MEGRVLVTLSNLKIEKCIPVVSSLTFENDGPGAEAKETGSEYTVLQARVRG